MSSRRRSFALLVFFVAATLGGGMFIGIANPPGQWYAELAKPGFTPPNWLFPVAWTLLYVLVAIAGWRVFERGPASARLLWVVQLALNFAWSPVFFGAHLVGAGLLVLCALLLATLGFLAVTRRAAHVACLCFVPYAAWVGYAAALNLAIWQLNRG